ncbi:MarR family transcriptional regulator [Kribbella sp. NPDC023855]|uniref:MarR family winged helix-turn-helix transcriptional regulator n=1 Tax=Kribbella sp. NPDC023855 TaxID=3154698 RepID=UPI0033C8F074
MTSSLLLLLKQAERRIEQQLLPILAEFGLSLEQWRVMSALADEPGLPMSTLAATAVLPNASLTRHVDKLVERGLVVRRIHADDRRRVVTALSPVGTTVAERLRAEERRIESAIASELGDDRLQGLAGGLRRLQRSL